MLINIYNAQKSDSFLIKTFDCYVKFKANFYVLTNTNAGNC